MNASISLNGLEIESSNQTTINQTPDWFNWFNADRSYISIVASGDANVQLDSIKLLSETETISSSGNASISLDQIEVSTEFAEIQSFAGASISLDGIEIQSEHGTITASASQSTNAIVSLPSILLSITAGKIIAKTDGKKQNLGGSLYIRPLSVRDGRAVLKPIMAFAFSSRVNAYGVIINNGFARIDTVTIDSEVSKISASGVLDIDDDDLLLLLAA